MKPIDINALFVSRNSFSWKPFPPLSHVLANIRKISHRNLNSGQRKIIHFMPGKCFPFLILRKTFSFPLFTKHLPSSSDYRDWRNWWIRRTKLEKKKDSSSSSQQRRRGGGMVSPSPSPSPSLSHTPWSTDNSARDLRSGDLNFNSSSKHDKEKGVIVQVIVRCRSVSFFFFFINWVLFYINFQLRDDVFVGH